MNSLEAKLDKFEKDHPGMKDHVELSGKHLHNGGSPRAQQQSSYQNSNGGGGSGERNKHNKHSSNNSDADDDQHQDSSSHWSKMPIIDTFSNSKTEFNAADNTLGYKLAVNASWAVNIFLLGAKMYVVLVSGSKAVTASLADSAVDLISQAILSLADIYMNKHNANYPVGRSRLEALSVIACAFIMSMASVEVIQFSAVDLYSGLNGNIPELHIDIAMYIILAVGIGLKILLYLYCTAVNKSLGSDIVDALAEDHLNDVWSNAVAIATAAIATHTTLWWFDPFGAILISVVIIYRWYHVIWEQVKKIAGHTAPKEFIEEVEKLASEHDYRIDVDCTRVYHFGARYNVEMEIVLPGSMTVRESHDIALALQHKIESSKDIERAFVHVDHEKRDGLEHKVERELVRGMLEASSASVVSSPFSPGWTEANNSNSSSSNNVQKRRPGKGLLTDAEHASSAVIGGGGNNGSVGGGGGGGAGTVEDDDVV